jgi:hypothetical protein
MYNELFAIIIIIFLYWFFNIQNENYIISDMSIEKMKNISVYNTLN